MDNNIMHTPVMIQTENHLMRIEHVKKRCDSAARRRLIGGVIVLIGMLALIEFLMYGSSFVAGIAVISLCTGSIMSWRVTHPSIYTFTDNMADTIAILEELEEQSD